MSTSSTAEPHRQEAALAALSIALVTRNRPASLERALESWRRQSVQPHEIVVSDDSGPDHADRVQALAARYQCRYVSGPRRGLYANRNFAALACTGSHILSADDDHEHPDGFLEAVMAAVSDEPDTVWTIGEFHGWDDYRSGRRFNAPGQLSPHGTLQPIPGDESGTCWSISDGATVYPRGVFDRGARFYEGVRFGPSYSEFGCLLRGLGWRIRPLLGTAVIHHLHEAPRSFNDPVEEPAASLFASFMFSFQYQPAFLNKLISLSKLPVNAVKRPRYALKIFRLALRHFVERRREVKRLFRAQGARAATEHLDAQNP